MAKVKVERVADDGEGCPGSGPTSGRAQPAIKRERLDESPSPATPDVSRAKKQRADAPKTPAAGKAKQRGAPISPPSAPTKAEPPAGTHPVKAEGLAMDAARAAALQSARTLMSRLRQLGSALQRPAPGPLPVPRAAHRPPPQPFCDPGDEEEDEGEYEEDEYGEFGEYEEDVWGECEEGEDEEDEEEPEYFDMFGGDSECDDEPFAWQRSWHSANMFQVRGITQYQDAARKVTFGTPLALVRERYHGVAILKWCKTPLMLGYVPTELSDNFQDGLYFGEVASVGHVPNEPSILGVRVKVTDLKPHRAGVVLEDSSDEGLEEFYQEVISMPAKHEA